MFIKRFPEFVSYVSRSDIIEMRPNGLDFNWELVNQNQIESENLYKLASIYALYIYIFFFMETCITCTFLTILSFFRILRPKLKRVK